MKKLVLLCLTLLLTFSFVGCTSEEKADIYTSIYPLEFLVNEIVGDEFVVRNAYPRGADVHSYELPAKRIVNMSESKAIFFIGAGLEKFIQEAKDTTFKNLGDDVVELSEYLVMLYPGEDHAHSHGDHDFMVDPHVWLDPERMIIMAEVILDKVIELKPDMADEFTANAEDLIIRLEKLHQKFIEELSDEKYKEKYILVDHDAYLYWEEIYGIKRMRIRPDNQSTEIDPKTMEQNLNKIKELGIKHIVVTENEAISSIIETYQHEADLEIATLHSLATITDKQHEDGLDYIDLMESNLRVLKRILPQKD